MEVVVKLTEEEQQFVVKYHDYAVGLIEGHDLEMSEYYDELCLFLCQLAHGYCSNSVDVLKTPPKVRLHSFVHNLVKKDLKKQASANYEPIKRMDAFYRGDAVVDCERHQMIVTFDYDAAFRTSLIRECIESLKQEEQNVLTLFAYFGDTYTCTDEWKKLGYSVEQSRNYLAKALRKLRHLHYSRNLKDFFYGEFEG